MKHKSCPFCGSNTLSIEYLYPAWGGDEKEAHVVCDECAASSPMYIWDNRGKSSGAVEKRDLDRQA
ncbi:hypothetical protein P7F88_07500 [Vibrio hannami]|uniref:Lar family restriction alleviation protein n=1 Tax=Vibrio hannami TaxID=2717094 RepID=UPI00241081B2|nr:Lar family restriction alleviation protein [Vibrio hannami]MDG3085949.1 hypothetical protein [Vibrio hannami]